METLLVNCIGKNLNQFMHKNAIFLSERLYAEFPSEVNLQLLARCYLNNKQPYCAYRILKGAQMAQSRYLFAISCFEMDLLREAEGALLPSKEPVDEVPNGAAGHYLLGLIYRYTDRKENSVQHFRKALSIDPLFWTAYEELCILGAAEEATAVFSEAAVCCVQEHHLGHESSYLRTAIEDQSSGSGWTFGFEDLNLRHLKHVQGECLGDVSGNYHREASLAGSSGKTIDGSSNVSLCNTPSPMPTQLSAIAPPPLFRNVQPKLTALGGESLLRPMTRALRRKLVAEDKSGKVPSRLFSNSGPRRSARLAAARTNSNTSQIAGNGSSHLCANSIGVLSSSSKSTSVSFHSSAVRNCQSESSDEGKVPEAFDDARLETSSSASSFGDGRPLTLDTKSMKPHYLITNSSTIISGVLDTLDLLRLLGEGYRLSCMYRCQDALDIYRKLSQKQYNTGWVLSQVGKAYFQLVDYLNACHAFSLARQVSPYILEGMDIYSTVLYHLKEDMKLSYLAQELITIDRLAPQSWCAVGNCYSLQKDHETALKSFSRAVQLNSKFAYAHTLCGHEYAALEDYENGVKCYNKALRADARHYNSWYGLGMIYLHQEKFEFAEHHFRQAFEINPLSSVIMCYIGTALHALKRSEEALEMMEKSIVTDKKNPLPVYHKANILASLGNFDKALEVLEELKEFTPCESSVYALMGKIYKQQKMYDKALFHFGIALDLKPSAADVATIKATTEKLLVPDEIEDDF